MKRYLLITLIVMSAFIGTGYALAAGNGCCVKSSCACVSGGCCEKGKCACKGDCCANGSCKCSQGACKDCSCKSN